MNKYTVELQVSVPVEAENEAMAAREAICALDLSQRQMKSLASLRLCSVRLEGSSGSQRYSHLATEAARAWLRKYYGAPKHAVAPLKGGEEAQDESVGDTTGDALAWFCRD